MNKVVLVGTSTPLQKVLSKIHQYQNIQFVALFTELGKSAEIERLAKSLNIPLYEIGLLKAADGVSVLKEIAPQWIFSVNSTIIFSPSILKIPSEGCLNLHPGKLPEYAGLHTHQWAIRHGEKNFGATLHWMDSKVDTGAIAFSEEFSLAPNETGISLFMKCIQSGTQLTIKALEMIDQGLEIPRISQDLSKRKIYRHRDAMNGLINWDWSAEKIQSFFRAADYRPFQSPTYIPTVELKGANYRITGVTIAEETDEKAGTIIQESGDHFHVAAGKNSSVWLKVKSS